MLLGCSWDVPEMLPGCSRDAPGMLLGCSRDAPCLPPVTSAPSLLGYPKSILAPSPILQSLQHPPTLVLLPPGSGGSLLVPRGSPSPHFPAAAPGTQLPPSSPGVATEPSPRAAGAPGTSAPSTPGHSCTPWLLLPGQALLLGRAAQRVQVSSLHVGGCLHVVGVRHQVGETCQEDGDSPEDRDRTWGQGLGTRLGDAAVPSSKQPVPTSWGSFALVTTTFF